MSTITIGRRVATFDDIEKAGDYCRTTVVNGLGHREDSVWFLLPIHEGATKYERPTEGSGIHRITQPPWEFRECDDGSLEVRASILTGRSAEHPQGTWHGYLDEGHRWRSLT